MKTTTTVLPAIFAPVKITLEVTSQAELDALHRMARTGLGKERTAAGCDASTSVPNYERAEMQRSGYGTNEGIRTCSAVLVAVSTAGGK